MPGQAIWIRSSPIDNRPARLRTALHKKLQHGNHLLVRVMIEKGRTATVTVSAMSLPPVSLAAAVTVWPLPGLGFGKSHGVVRDDATHCLSGGEGYLGG